MVKGWGRFAGFLVPTCFCFQIVGDGSGRLDLTCDGIETFFKDWYDDEGGGEGYGCIVVLLYGCIVVWLPIWYSMT